MAHHDGHTSYSFGHPPAQADDELVRRLRKIAEDAALAKNRDYYIGEKADTTYHEIEKYNLEAASRISALSSEVERLRAALEFYAHSMRGSIACPHCGGSGVDTTP